MSMTSASDKLQKYKFWKEEKPVVLKVVMEYGAHLSGHDEKDKVFKKF